MTEVVAGQPYVSIKVDRNKIARYGMNVSDVLNVIEIAMGGKPASEIYQESKVFDLVLRLPSQITKFGTVFIGDYDRFKAGLQYSPEPVG